MRAICVVARLGKLKKLMIKMEEETRYMENGRTAMYSYSFKHGWRWTVGGIKYSNRWVSEDKDLLRTEVMHRNYSSWGTNWSK